MPPKNGNCYVLAVNAGSSSLKTSLYSLIGGVGPKSGRHPQLIIKAEISGLFSSPKLTYTRHGSSSSSSSESVAQKADIDDKIETEKDAFEYLVKKLQEDELFKEDKDLEGVQYVCHRVVHGGHVGEQGPVILDEKVEEKLKKITTLAPLHNGPAISIIDGCKQSLPHATNIAFFDTSFHESMPTCVKAYAIDQEIAKRDGLRKYGFHGLSYSFITKNAAKLLGKKAEDTSLIALHLGGGSSICAIKGGRSIDTSMGLTPLEGLPSGSRSGSIDPSLIFHYTTHPTTSDQISPTVHLTHSEALLNKSCGFKALASTSDFGSIMPKYSSDENSRLAVDVFVDRMLGYIGAYWLKLSGATGGVDAIVFAGGIGEASTELRKMLVERLRAGLGDVISGIDEERNKNAEKEKGDGAIADISADEDGKVKVLVCWTDEQMEMVEELCGREDLLS